MSEDTMAIPEVNIDAVREYDKPRLDALLFADYAAITDSGKPDVCGVFGRIIASRKTKKTGDFYLFIRVLMSAKAIKEIIVIDPEGNTVAAGKIETPIEEGVSDIQMVHVLQRMALNVRIEGIYWFNVLHDKELLGRAALTIEYEKQEANDGNGDS